MSEFSSITSQNTLLSSFSLKIMKRYLTFDKKKSVLLIKILIETAEILARIYNSVSRV